jgi:hypothetical protein
MQNFFHIWPNFFDKFAVNPFWDLSTVAIECGSGSKTLVDTWLKLSLSLYLILHLILQQVAEAKFPRLLAHLKKI